MTTTLVCDTCPESVPITIIEAPVVELDGDEVLWYDEYFTTLSPEYVSARKAVQLAHDPVSPEAVQVAVNGALLARKDAALGRDGFVSEGSIVILPTALAAGATLHVHYMGRVEAADPDAIPVGLLRQTIEETAPAYWAMCDDETEYLVADYRMLYAWATNKGMLGSVNDGTAFTLADLEQEIGGMTMRMLVYAGTR